MIGNNLRNAKQPPPISLIYVARTTKCRSSAVRAAIRGDGRRPQCCLSWTVGDRHVLDMYAKQPPQCGCRRTGGFTAQNQNRLHPT